MDEGDFTKARSIIFPRNVLVGHGVLGQIPEVCKEFGLSGTALLVTGPKTKDVASEKIKMRLDDGGYDVHSVVVGEATKDNLDKVEEVAREVKANFLIGIGGGSKIDLAKMAAKDLGVEFISVPTSASHDGIASGRASIKGEDGPLSLDAKVPLGVVADTSVIVGPLPTAGIRLRRRDIQFHRREGLGVRQEAEGRGVLPLGVLPCRIHGGDHH
ncbi:MAG TPA: iron-containing alcohol dehydrogenase [Methanomassiliicoccaceae archaeon]|nr:iron-containing alcohol dehydrogenase [Methanomassiliicoccaceae archaeon]